MFVPSVASLVHTATLESSNQNSDPTFLHGHSVTASALWVHSLLSLTVVLIACVVDVVPVDGLVVSSSYLFHILRIHIAYGMSYEPHALYKPHPETSD
jgi:hypothetical protein